MIIISVVYNKPEFISYQYECLKKFIEVPFEYYIFDNADDSVNEQKFKEVCSYLNIKYFKVPQNIHQINDASTRAGKSLDYSLRYVYNTIGYRGILMVNDSDMFLVKPYNPISRLGDYHIAGRSASGIYSGNNDPHTSTIERITYYTNQVLIMNFEKIPNFNRITFLPGNIGGIGVDCGGLLHTYFKLNPDVTHFPLKDTHSNFYSKDNIEQCQEEMKEYFKSELAIFDNNSKTDTAKNKAFSEIFDDAFIHLRAGSNWVGHDIDILSKREDNLFTFLCKKLIDWESLITPSDDNKYIVSFSLYGNSPKYCYNAIVNAILVNKIYSGWKARFYYDDTVPENITRILTSIPNTELVLMKNKKSSPGSERMLWRFYPASDSSVAAMISRDCDSWISFREAFSVKEWIKSDKSFHIIRDHCYHSQKIMGGMWGVKRNTIQDMETICERFMETDTYDQGFLASQVYPKILSSVLVHTGDQYTNEGKKTVGYFNDGGLPIVQYPLVRSYIPTVDIEHMNTINSFHCAHCKKTHNFFIGEMFNNLSLNVKLFLSKNYNLEVELTETSLIPPPKTGVKKYFPNLRF